MTGWGWEYCAPGRSPALSQNLTSSIILPLILICNFFSFIHVQIQNDRRKESKRRTKELNFLSIPPRLQTDAHIHSASVVFCFRYHSLSSLWLFLKLKADILFVMSPCSPAVTSPQCLHSRYYFWLSVLHLGAQWSLFHFLCHNAIAQISLRGITLLEKRITYVVSQTHPSSPYPTGADDQWVCQCQGLRTKKEGRRKRRVFWKHVTWTIIHLQSEEQNNMNPPYQNPEEKP